jgi:hypothetical protein
MAVGHDLDPDGFTWLDKHSPGLDRMLGAGELGKAPIERRPNRRAIPPGATFQDGATLDERMSMRRFEKRAWDVTR